MSSSLTSPCPCPTPCPMRSSSRSTPLTTTTLTSKCFGGVQVMAKEEHEKERQRWASKLDEVENRLVEAETSNVDMAMIKAELKKKIVELERNQKPMIENNRRLTERNKTLQLELKKLEQKWAHSQDDYLSLRDVYERLLKENNGLKEKRSFPEKLEELERYRNQVLEYSKCITALRQSALEKDRRFDRLVIKLKRLKKVLIPSRQGQGGTDEDRHSVFAGSDCSADSSISLDTITEDLVDESVDQENDVAKSYSRLAREHAELLHVFELFKITRNDEDDDDQQHDQLLQAHAQIAQLRSRLQDNEAQQEKTSTLMETIEHQRDQLIGLQARSERLERELLDLKEHSELIEFQLLEERSLHANLNSTDTAVTKTDKAMNTDCIDDEYVEEMEQDHKNIDIILNEENIMEMKKTMKEMINDRHRYKLNNEQWRIVTLSQAYHLSLESQLIQGEEERMAEKEEYKRREENFEDEIQRLESEMKNKEEHKRREENFADEIHRLESEMKNKIDMIDQLQPRLQLILGEREQWVKSNKTLKDQLMQANHDRDTLRGLLQEGQDQIALLTDKCDQLMGRLSELMNSRECALTLMDEKASKQNDRLNELKIELKRSNEEGELMREVIDEMRTKMSAAMNEVERLMINTERTPPTRTDLERRFEEAKYRLVSALEKLHQQEHNNELAMQRIAHLQNEQSIAEQHQQSLQVQIVNLTTYNQHLERQFTTQIHLIDALKEKVMSQQNGMVLNEQDTLQCLPAQLQKALQSQDDDQCKAIVASRFSNINDQQDSPTQSSPSQRKPFSTQLELRVSDCTSCTSSTEEWTTSNSVSHSSDVSDEDIAVEQQRHKTMCD